ncbi:MAG: AAA family ATPase, partial [Bacteroidales bacterium]|nr:AAA family ATPase [Bacteroidales bacterium]
MMTQRNYYVVSPNVWNDGNFDHLVSEMKSRHIVLMGWQSDNPKGQMFDNVKKNDVILVAWRQNWQFNYYFLGIVKSDETLKHPSGAQCKALSVFIDLENIQSDILNGWSTAGSTQIPAIGRIDGNKNPDIIKTIQNLLILDLIKRYKDKFLNVALIGPYIEGKQANELYKWRLITDCKDKSSSEIIDSVKRNGYNNLIYAKGVIPVWSDLLKTQSNDFVAILEKLRNESKPLSNRLFAFKNEMINICENKFKYKADDERTAATFLTCVNPFKYTFYKFELYQNYCEFIGEETKNPCENYPHYLKLLGLLSNAVEQDVALQNKFKTETNGLIQSDLLIAQNILWQMRNDMFSTVETKDNKQMQEMNDYTELLKKKKNIILQGAPGVGKTYTTAALALSICGEDVPVEHKDVMKRYKELQKEGRIGFVTFHQSMDYEDFVEGIKPSTDNGTITYDVEDGIFKQISIKAQAGNNFDEIYDKFISEINDYDEENVFKIPTPKGTIFGVTVNTKNNLSLYVGSELQKTATLTKENIRKMSEDDKSVKYYQPYFRGVVNILKSKGLKSQKNTDKNYVLIIDEINRGNVSKIFGELITLLEADKRIGGKHPLKVTLPYSKDEFGVPSNLYIIGTMNTTDRSVGNIDYAVRRRFAFVTLESKREIVEQYSTVKAVNRVDAVKTFIENN